MSMDFEIKTNKGIIAVSERDIANYNEAYHRRKVDHDSNQLNLDITKERYFKLRDTAWDILLENGIKKLPISCARLADRYGLPLAPFNSNEDVLKLEYLLPSDDGSYLPLENGRGIIFYNQTQSAQRIRFTIIHELGHHLLKNLTAPYNVQERECDYMAARVLMPAGLLKACNIKSAKEIAKLCDISLQAALRRYEEFKELLLRDKFFSSAAEKQLIINCEEFIRQYNVKKGIE